MKTTPASVRSLFRICRPGLTLLAVTLVVTTSLLAAKNKPAPVKNDPVPPDNKPFVLYQGADIDVQFDNEIHRVKSIVGNAFVIAVNNQPVEVPVNRGAVKMKVTPQLKLTNKTAAVKGLKFERAYTPENDPNKKWA